MLPAHSRRLLIPLLGTLLISCGGGGEPSATPAHIEIVAGNNQTSQVTTAVPMRPSVKVTDADGNPVAGATVTFTVATGNGSVIGPSRQTDANGIATVGDWILGTFVGTNRLNAGVSGVAPVSFTATATPGSAATVSPVTPVSQTSVVGAAVAPPPAVRVEDSFGNGIAGIQVIFTVAGGGGSVTGGTQTTNANGVATVASWTLGSSPGTNSLRATVQASGIAGNPLTFTATGSNSAYAIDLRFLSGMTPSQAQAFQSARTRLQAMIFGDVSDVPVNFPAGSCLPSQPAMNETVDDLVIFAQVAAIDGPGGILGQAGPCLIRGSSSLPVVGIMQFDVADLNTLESSGLLQPVILHEMLHVIGFGSIWSSKSLLSGSTGTDPFFTGAQAIASFNSIGGTAFVGNRVPVEGTGGPGTRNSHWRETVFKTELMTGFLNSGTNPLSVVTASSMADLGYTVNANAADPFTIQPPFVLPPAVVRAGVSLIDDHWNGPLFEIDPFGSPRRVPRP